EFITGLDKLDEIPTTSVPSPMEMKSYFEEATRNHDEAIYISPSAKLTSMNSLGLQTAKELKSKGKHIEVFDSYATISIQGIYSYQANLLAQKDTPMAKILEILINMREKGLVVEYGTIETLKYLQ